MELNMALKRKALSRRDFLKYSGLAGFGAGLGDSIMNVSYAASRERLTILSSIALDTLHPYAHSSSPHYGIWNNMLEPLVEVDYGKKIYYGILAQSWEFQGKKWIFKLRRNVRFHDGSPFTAADVIYSINRMKNDKQSLQRDNFRDLTEMQALDDHAIAFTTEAPNAVFLDRLQNRFIISKSATEAQGGDPGEQKPVGTGPYRFVSWQRDGNLVVTRHDNYWGTKAAI
jgi:peptide/nickel transport system substrate-binding protein